jgi:hypothetical protein
MCCKRSNFAPDPDHHETADPNHTRATIKAHLLVLPRKEDAAESSYGKSL